MSTASVPVVSPPSRRSGTGDSPPSRPAADNVAACTDDERTCGSDDVECVAQPVRVLPRPLPKPKRMLQATLSFSDSTTEERLKREIAERDAKIDELQAKLHALDAENAQEGRKCDDVELALSDIAGRVARYQEAMKALMIETARAHRRDARRWQHQQHFELGHIANVHHPVTGMTEMWVEGNTARRLINEENDIRQRQREIESRKARPRKGKDDDDSAVMDIDEEAEMRKMELASLKAAEAEVQMRRVQYKQDIDAFAKELRRIHDEDASPFALRETIGKIVHDPSTARTSAAPAGMEVAQLSGGTGATEPSNEERYVLLYLLGRGGFSEVWKAFDLIEGRYVACKVHKVNRQWSLAAQSNYLLHAERELEIQRVLDHPRVMKLYDVFQYDPCTFVSVMEYSGGEDLERRLKRTRAFREPEARLILMQVLSALRHLATQERPVIHYDLKPANIIFHSSLASCLEVKVTDFGLSKIINTPTNTSDPSVELTSQQCGTFFYLPPECFAQGAKITPKVDIWACGVIFYQMLYGKRPFASDATQADIYNNKLIVTSARKGVEFPPKPQVSPEAKEIIKRCLAFEVSQRPDIHQLCAEPYFSKRPGGKRRVNAVMATPRGEPSPVGTMPPPS